MPTVERFEDLVVWQEAREIVKVVYRLTSKFPRKELYGLADQIQKAAVSTMSNIAEGFESGTNKQFTSFLYTAKGSNGEVRSQTYVALDLDYISQVECGDLVKRCDTLSRRIYNFIEYLKDAPFDGPRFRESGPVWYVNEPET